MLNHLHQPTLILLAAILVLTSCRHSPQEYSEEEQRLRATVVNDCLSFVDEVDADDYDPPVKLVTDRLEISGEPVTHESFDRFVRYYAPIDDGVVREGYVGRFLSSLLLYYFWKKRLDEQEVYVARGEVDDTFELIRRRFPGDRAFAGFLGAVRATPSSLRAAVCRDLRLRKYIAKRVDLSASDREVRAFFEAHRPSLEASLRRSQVPEFTARRARLSARAVLERT